MKIDFVITWVDGNDPQWRKEKNQYTITKILYLLINREKQKIVREKHV